MAADKMRGTMDAKTDGSPGAQQATVGVEISARLGSLSGSIINTAVATYSRIGIGSLEAKVLLVLAETSMTSAAIARALGIDRSAISRTVRALDARQLINKPPGRVAYLSLTGAGRRLRAAVQSISDEREKRLLARFSDEERRLLAAYLERLADNMPELFKLAE